MLRCAASCSASGCGSISSSRARRLLAEQQRLIDLTIALVDTINGELSPNFWRPNRQPAQDALATKLFERLMHAGLPLETPQIDALVDNLMELARANHERLQKA